MRHFLFILCALFVVFNVWAVDFLEPETLLKCENNHDSRFRIEDDVDYDGDIDWILYDVNGPLWVEDTDGDGIPDLEHDLTDFSYWIESIEFVDMNNDNYKDMVVTVLVDDNFYIFTNDGAGNFTLEVYESGIYKSDNALYYDFNNDGIKDVYLSGWGATVYMTRSTVTDSFQVYYPNHSVGIMRSGIANDYSCIADINNDGYMDILGINSNLDSLIWYEFDPVYNSFRNYNSISNYHPYSDFDYLDADNDGDTDISFYDYNTQTLYLLENDVNHDFSQMTVIADSLNRLEHLIAADINNDGLKDLIIYHDDNQLETYLNSTTGFVKNNELSIFVSDLFIEDVNDDGLLDITAEINYDDYLYLFNNNGSFDFNNCKLDGLGSVWDVKVEETNNSEEMIIRGSWYVAKANQDNGEWVVDDHPVTDICYIEDFACADLDGNGELDYIVAENYVSNSGMGEEITNLVLYLNGQRQSNLLEFDHFFNSATELNLQDIDNDGDLDLTCSVREYWERSVRVFKNINGFTDSEMYSILDFNPNCYVFDDIDGDNDSDLIYSDINGDVYLSVNTDSCNYATPVQVLDADISRFIYEDMNGDGIKDILKLNTWQDSTIAVYSGNASNGFSSIPMVLGSLSPVNKAYVDDIDSDGDNDLVYSASVGYYDRICVLENHGVMSNWNNILITEVDAVSGCSFRLYDFNEDGLKDIVYFGVRGKEICMVQNNSIVIPNLDEDVPEVATKLIGNYPNPFNPETKINYSMAKAGNAELTIYNIKGQRVKTLINDHIEAGDHSIVWNGKDKKGADVSSGVYFYRLKTADGVQNRKMLLLK